jgi:hypothetical protein
MQHSLASSALDTREALKILRFRFRRDVGLRPVLGNGGVSYSTFTGTGSIAPQLQKGKLPIGSGASHRSQSLESVDGPERPTLALA